MRVVAKSLWSLGAVVRIHDVAVAHAMTDDALIALVEHGRWS